MRRPPTRRSFPGPAEDENTLENNDSTSSKSLRNSEDVLHRTKMSRGRLKHHRTHARLAETMSQRVVTVPHIVFVVHGMGQRHDVFLEKIASLQSLIHSAYQTVSCSKAKQGEHEPFELEQKVVYQHLIELVPIEWHEALHEIITPRMDSVNLNTVPVMRQVNNKILADVLYYFTAKHRRVIAEIVIGKMNAAMEKFREQWPGIFDSQQDHVRGTVDVVGHSLGGVICYDIIAQCSEGNEPVAEEFEMNLRHIKLPFTPNHLFTIGSPVAAVMVMRGLDPINYHLPESCRFHNIYHLYDPFGYRIEPLFVKECEEPEVLPLAPKNPLTSFPSPNLTIPSLPFSVPSMSFSVPTLPAFSTSFSISAFFSESRLISNGFQLPKFFSWLPENLSPSQRLSSEQLPSLTREKEREDSQETTLFSFFNLFRRAFSGEITSPSSPSSSPLPTPAVSGQANIDQDRNVDSTVDEEKRTDKELNTQSQLPYRMDKTLQFSLLETMSHEYLSGLSSHFSYWSNKDVAYYLVQSILKE